MALRLAVGASLFDASALAKVYVAEPLSDVVTAFFRSEATKYTTPFCFYETLTLLKAKWIRKDLSKDAYMRAVQEVTVWYGASSTHIADIDFHDYLVLNQARDLVAKWDFDFSDAFQILSVKTGYFSRLCNASKTVFVTADNTLAQAAESEGLRVWNVNQGPAPTRYVEDISPLGAA